MSQEVLKSSALALRDRELESIRQAIDESLNDPRPGVPHEQAMEELGRYVKERIQYYLAKKRTA